MLTEEQRERIEVVLVSPRNPLNIGAAARAMANFGFGRLAVVAPYEAHWREAKSAVGAEELLQTARREEGLAAAVAECTLAIGTGTVARRRPEQMAVTLPEVASRVAQELERGGRVALVFGPEKHGLTRDELGLCHLLVEIPTQAGQPSMNLGQAVAVCLYELAVRGSKAVSGAGPMPAADDGQGDEGPASMRDLDRLAGVVAEAMRAAHYSPAAMARANRHDVDVLLRRLSLRRRDARRILGLFRRILWRIQH